MSTSVATQAGATNSVAVAPVASNNSQPQTPAVPAEAPTLLQDKKLEEMPDPKTIAKQKDMYIQMMNEQVKQGTAVLESQAIAQKALLHSQAAKQKQQFQMQLDLEVRSQQSLLEQARMSQLLAIKQKAAVQKQELESRAMQLTIEYQQRKSDEELQKQQSMQEEQQSKMQSTLSEKMDAFQNSGNLFLDSLPALSAKLSAASTYVYSADNHTLVPKSPKASSPKLISCLSQKDVAVSLSPKNNLHAVAPKFNPKNEVQEVIVSLPEEPKM